MEKQGETVPEILIRGQEVAMFVKTGKTDTVRVCFENLVPAPQHISVHVEVDMSSSVKMQGFVEQDGVIARRDGTAIDCLGIRSFETKEDCLGGVVPRARDESHFIILKLHSIPFT